MGPPVFTSPTPLPLFPKTFPTGGPKGPTESQAESISQPVKVSKTVYQKKTRYQRTNMKLTPENFFSILKLKENLCRLSRPLTVSRTGSSNPAHTLHRFPLSGMPLCPAPLGSCPDYSGWHWQPMPPDQSDGLTSRDQPHVCAPRQDTGLT